MNGFADDVWPAEKRVAGRELRDIQVGYELANIDDVDDTLLSKLVAFEGTDRNRYFVNALLALGRRDGDFFDKGIAALCERRR
jgi:hypothetical protein